MKRIFDNYLVPAMFMLWIGVAVVIGTLNVAVFKDRVTGKVISLEASESKYALGTVANVEISGGRLVKIFIPTHVKVPSIGSPITLSHYQRRFFGEDFGP